MNSQPLGPLSPGQRRQAALDRRFAAALAQNAQAHGVSQNNGDDSKYGDRRASFTKGLPHDSQGLVSPGAYMSLLNALKSGAPNDFEHIQLGGPRKLINPQAGLAFEMIGNDPQSFSIPPAPAFESDEIAAEIVENYWMALLRDVPFSEYATNPGVSDAANELTGFGLDFKGAKDNAGNVAPQTLFRGLTPGDKVGPYISQFLMLPVPFGAQGFEQVMRTPKAGIDFVLKWDDYLQVQRGADRGFAASDFDKDVYIRNGRDLSQWVHIDVLFQAYFNAMLILLTSNAAPTPVGGGIAATQDVNNPYLHFQSYTQAAFGTFGDPYIAATLCEVASRALKAVWCQKWFVHRRLRPEVFAARIHSNLTKLPSAPPTDFPISSKLIKRKNPQPTDPDEPKWEPVTPVLARVAAHNQGQQNGGDATYLLPLAFPEGSPIHPAYGAGHATVAGACVTLLKAFFDEDQPFPNPMKVNAAGDGLEPYFGDALTIGGELNKLASNVAIGRNIAGVHWRSDGTESLYLGEEVAIALLRDHKLTFNERFAGWKLTRFDGRQVVI